MKSKFSIGLPIFFASLNMRAGLVLLSPLIPILKNAFGLSNTALSILAGIPLVCFAGTSLMMGYIGKLGSSNRIIKWALTVLSFALIARAFTGVIGLFIFTVLMGLAIAVMNYEIPAWVKANTPESAGFITGIYVTIMGSAAAISIAVSVPLAELNSLSWRMAMLPWMAIATLTTLYWWLNRSDGVINSIPVMHFWRSKAFRNPLAWALVAFFGLESMCFYATATWLPTILTTKDLTLTKAAIMVSISGVIGSLVGLMAPHYIGKISDKRLILSLTALLTAFAFFMITLQTGAILFLWLALSNIGISISFPMALMMAGEKSATPEATRNLSTMMQSCGYFLSATGPIYMAKLFERTNNWDTALYGIVFICFAQVVAGLFVGKTNQIAI